jgi:magnesium transporter
MIRSLYRAQDGQIRTSLEPAEFSAALRDSQGLLWVDLVDEPAEVCEPILLGTFGFHPLAVDDALQESHVPKVDDWGAYLYLVLHAVTWNHEGEELLDTVELDVFLGKNYVVTYQARRLAAPDRVWTASARDRRHLEKGPAYLLYKVADELVADYLPVVEEIDDTIDRIEDQVFGSAEPTLLEQVFDLKRALLHLRRIIAPQREVLNKLARGDYAVVSAEERFFFRDVYDHLVRLYDISEGLRDLVGGALDTYLSVVNNRMNEVMKTLTIITTLFMPLSFLVGFFGMNFFEVTHLLPPWTSLPAFLVVLAAMVLIPATMYLWMRRRAWM